MPHNIQHFYACTNWHPSFSQCIFYLLIYATSLVNLTRHSQCGQNHGYYPEASWSYVVGYGIGALSAVAASCSQNVQQFLTAALAVIKIALKVGLVTSQAANSIEPLSTFKSSWSACFRGLSFKDALSALAKFTLDEVYHLKETFPTLNRGSIHRSFTSVRSLAMIQRLAGRLIF